MRCYTVTMRQTIVSITRSTGLSRAHCSILSFSMADSDLMKIQRDVAFWDAARAIMQVTWHQDEKDAYELYVLLIQCPIRITPFQK